MKCSTKNRKGKKSKKVELFSPFQNIFNEIDKIMCNMHTQMKKVKKHPNSHSYTSSAVMSYHNDGKSRPKVMQASTSTRTAPGKIKETCHTYRNSESGVEKISVGRHIGKRGHEHKKKRVKGGVIQEKQKFYDMDENELPEFEKEWRLITTANGVKAVHQKQKRSCKGHKYQKRRKLRRKR